MNRETECLIVAAQNQNIRTNLAKAKIEKSQGMCREVDEGGDYIVSSCSKLEQKRYKRRHDNLGKIVHWKFARKCDFED